MAVVPRHLTGQTRTEAVCYRSADRTLGGDFIIGAILDISISGRRIRRLDRNEMHQSRGGVLSEHRTLWTTQDLNALDRSEEHTAELKSLMRISYAVFCLKNRKKIDQ